MSLTVLDRARAMATFRFVEVRLMEIVARWTPLTPEMEVKVLFGRHIWDFAQHADALGHRTFELRLPKHHALPPAEAYAAVLKDLADLTATPDRLGGLYDVVLPGLGARYRRYLETTDRLLDAPSVVIVEGILSDVDRQRRDLAMLRQELGIGAADVEALHRREASTADLVAS